MSKHADFTTPILGVYGNAERDLDHQIFESDLPEGVQERVKNAQMFNLAQSKGQALANAAAQEHAAKTGSTATLAGLTNPQLVNSRSTTVEPFNWGGLATAGLMGAGTAMS